MKITGLETIRVADYSNLLLVRIHTDDGLIGLGETYRNVDAIEAYLHESCAPYLIGKDPQNREALSQGMARYMGNHNKGFPTRSVEVRGNSAADIALWDLCGQAAGVPVYQLLGGLTQPKTRIYNTCAGGSYNTRARVDYDSEIHCRSTGSPGKIGEYEDLLMQVYEPVRLAEELLEDGITAMKIWPFDVVARETRGQSISASQLRDAIWPIEEIRKAVGDRIDIMLEYHGMWHLSPAIKIARAAEEYGIYWHEDPIWMQNFSDLARYGEAVTSPVCGSENMGTLAWYREMFDHRPLDIANFDIAWIGGITEGQKIAHFAQAHDRTIAPHDCTGPVTLVANSHMLAAASNGLIAETVRSYCADFYPSIVTEMPNISEGYISPPTGAGLGTRLQDSFLSRDEVGSRVSGRTAS